MKTRVKLLCLLLAAAVLAAFAFTGCKKGNGGNIEISAPENTETEELVTISDMLDYAKTYVKTFYSVRDYLKEDFEYADTTFTMIYEKTYTEMVTLKYKDENGEEKSGKYENKDRQKVTATYSVKKVNGEIALLGVIEDKNDGVEYSVNADYEVTEDTYESTDISVYTMMAKRDGDDTRYYLFADYSSAGTDGGLAPKAAMLTCSPGYREFEDRVDYYDAFAKTISFVQNYYFNNLIMFGELEEYLLGGNYSIVKKGNDLSLNAGINLFLVEDGTPYVTEQMSSYEAKYVNNESVTFTMSDKFIEAVNNYSIDTKTYVNVKNGADAKIEEKNPDDYDEKLYLEFGVFVPTSGIMR